MVLVVQILFGCLLVLAILWTSGALYFDLGKRGTSGWLFVLCWWLICAGIVLFVQPLLLAACILTAIVCGLLLWWFRQRPSHEGDWDKCFAELPSIRQQRNQIHVQNFRSARYPGVNQCEVTFSDRSFDLDQLQAVDALIIFWGSSWICHPMAVFDFGDQHLCISIEVRYRNGDSYAVLPSIYRQHELMYVMCDEQDAIERRLYYYEEEIDCYLYRLRTDKAFARELLEEYIDAANRLAENPRWYNAITSNCTTEIFQNRREKIPWDWRMLINGRFDKLLYEKELLHDELPFEELKAQSHINPFAKEIETEDFSRQLRRVLPLFSSEDGD